MGLSILLLQSCISVNYDKVVKINTVEAFEKFLVKNPNNEKYSNTARLIMDSLAFEDAKNKNTIKAYNDYLLKFVKGKYISKAKVFLNFNGYFFSFYSHYHLWWIT